VAILSIENLTVSFNTPHGKGNAVDGISFNLEPNETLGIVGESGCGKTVTALSILKLLPQPPAQIESGKILLNGEDILSMKPDELRKVRGDKIAMIFQEPMTALNPVFKVGSQIGEVYQIHQNLSKKESHQKAVEMLKIVGMPDSAVRADEYPHQLSGGMRQRVMIAMALALNPSILIADEPTTALDVTVQAQILELMDELKKKFGTALIFITHDLGVVAQHCQRVAVMYAGKIVESGTAIDIFKLKAHPYTALLMESIPTIKGREEKKLAEIPGMVPPLHERPEGCAFHPRCPKAMDECKTASPPVYGLSGTHQTACFLYK